MQEIADSEGGFKVFVTIAKEEVVADPEEEGIKVVHTIQILGLVGEGGQYNELRVFMHGTQKRDCCFASFLLSIKRGSCKESA